MADSTTERASAHDLELVALAATGGRAAFGELIRRHGSAVRGLLRRMGAAPALADDVARDAFLAAFEQISDFRGEGTFESWVKRIAARLYVRRWRRQSHDQTAPQSAGTAADPESSSAPAMNLEEALKALSSVERLCVCLCYGVGFSHAETAEALNMPLATVRSHLRRGLDELRRRLATGRDFDPDEAESRG
jgi:RNA polymerase sigma-70 factor, ECF subfamily